MVGDNIFDELHILTLSVPDNLTLLEKVRWIYIKAGELFSYDYTILDGDSVPRVDLKEGYINSYQTCFGVSEILSMLLNHIDPGIKCNVIEREGVNRGRFEEKHRANEVIIGNEKYILDLTLDLYLIQSGCQTKEFGFSSSPDVDYDIISLSECREMDEKMGLLKNGEYTDKKINDLRSELGRIDFSNKSFEEILDIKSNKVNTIIPKFKGFFEGKNFINRLFKEVLCVKYKEFNLYNGKNMITFFEIINGEEKYWYLYGKDIGFVKSSSDVITSLLNTGWQTRSETLLDEIEDNYTL